MEYNVDTRIEAITRRAKKKEGGAYIDKNGKPFTVVSIKVDETLINDRDWTGWCSVMDYKNDYDYKEGDMLVGIISKREVDDNIYWNFRRLSRIDILEERVSALEETIEQLAQGRKTVKVKEVEKEELADEEEIEVPF